MTLTDKYRPTKFSDLVGQTAVKAVLTKMLSQDQSVPAFLFSGPKGSGKTSTARILAKARSCQSNGTRPCNECEDCRDADLGLSMMVIEIDGASTGLVEDVRRLQENLRYSFNGNRTVIIDEAQSLSKSAFNAMLKILEEPPSGVSFVFVTTEPSKIPETVLSRCMTFNFKKLSNKLIVEHLSNVADKEGVCVDESVLKLVADSSDGSVRNSLISFTQVLAAGISTSEQYYEMTGQSDFAPNLLSLLSDGFTLDAFSLAERALDKTGDASWASDQLIKALKDVMILHAGGKLDLDGTRLKWRTELARKVPAVKALAALKLLWDSKVRPRQSEDPRLIFDMTLLLIGDTLK